MRVAAVSRIAARFAFWGWAALVSIIGATLLNAHWVPLPLPDRDAPELGTALATTLDPGERDRWLAVHVLYTDCPCSVRIIEHLLDSERPAAAIDKVILVGDPYDFERRLRGAGFWVEAVSPEALRRRFAIEAAPLLAVLAPQTQGGHVEYLGGYTSRKQGPDIQDVEIIERLASHDGVTEHPVYGCGVSRRLQRLLDPLGVKY